MTANDGDREVIAYFSMEVGLEADIPTYAGGLGMLAGDTIRSAADLEVPFVAVSLVHRMGYFRQRLDDSGNQSEEPIAWQLADKLRELSVRAEVEIERRQVGLRIWCYEVVGITGYVVPVYLLDANVAENSEWDRALTDFLYGGDAHYRLCQEIVLGVGGVRALRALGYQNIRRFHMNEGHSSLLTLELMHERARQAGATTVARELAQSVKPLCVFTTHTPVAAGHDQFPIELVRRVASEYGGAFDECLQDFCLDRTLNMTYLGLGNSRYINGVAKRHGEVSQHMFGRYKIDSITNGVHVATWAAPSFVRLFDRDIADWRKDNASLRYALGISKGDIWQAHQVAKLELLREISASTEGTFDPTALTLGFARRATAYKRADLLFFDPQRLIAMAKKLGALQVVFAGKAHPRDEGGKEMIRRIFRSRDELGEAVRVAYLPDYDMRAAKLLIAGVDLWLNTPQAPLEASGTSGMKAAVNAVPSLSVLDGWWLEGCIEGVTGWSIGGDHHSFDAGDDRAEDAMALYDKLEGAVLPMFYRESDRYVEIMRHAIALNGSFFNTERMVNQYVTKAYFR
jgi:glycogen phosphorylase